ncbi:MULTISPECIES: DNA ligase D [unclassified Devosia]|uniref:DNA ligase D n=1 Tax=unclassified Devosia TaxID=196773 RepID=UPI0015570551|nr:MULTISPECIES: DNA ligase D [unclassified Devosia]
MATKSDTLLKDYRAKRDFAKTQEPSGESAAKQEQAGAPLSFVVQKHDATRLHYDFRIELDGVLKSWAVTKGPSDNPADKRLAVHVEDHPLDYGTFEGTIPEGEYGGGTVMLWDEGTWEPIGDPHEGLENGDLKMRINGKRMKGEWVLVHMKGRDTARKSGPARENWLLIKHKDDYAKPEETLTTRFTTSVSTGRDLAGIAKGLKPKKASATPADAVWHSNREPTPDAAPKAKPTKTAKPARKSSAKSLALPEFRPPQLATLVDEVPQTNGWVFEMKYDGYRCLAALSGDQVRLYTRNANDWTTQFAAIVPALSQVTSGSALIDGELCALDDKGRTDFSTLKNALSTGESLVYFAFDLLEQDGEDLTTLPLTERKTRLQALLGETGPDSPIQFSTHVVGNGLRVFQSICSAGHEGVIAKQADAPYRGERSRSWLKVKCSKRQEFVIAGWSTSTKKKSFASLLLGTWEDGKLIYRGRVGTGFTRDEAQALQQQLDARASKTNPFSNIPRAATRGANWVKPELVGEVAFTEFTPDGVLRHPSFMGLREDKPASEVVIEAPAALPAEASKRSAAKSAPAAKAEAQEPAEPAKLDREAGLAAAEKAGLHITSPDRVIYPGQGVTKADLLAYYAAVADRMLPYIADRPLSLVRCPQGRAKYCFFQKHDSGGFPDAMKTVMLTEKDGSEVDYFYVDSLAGLLAGTQMNVMEWHLWGARKEDVERPERIIFDIDPDEGLAFADVRAAARDIAKLLEELGLKTYPLVSGGKGIHVIAPLTPKAQWPEVKAFCKRVAQVLSEREPDRFIANMSKAKRKGKFFVDYLRNERGSTAVSPWSSRSREGAPAAVPVTWEELEAVNAANQFTLALAAERAKRPDPWTGYFDVDQAITPAMRKEVGTPDA